MKRVLVPDRQFALAHALPNAIELFPRPCTELPKWHLPFERNAAYTREIVRAKDRLAVLFSDRVYSTKLPYRKEAMESFYHSLSNGITFLIGDRLLRLNALLAEIPAADITLPDVGYRHDPRESTTEFLTGRVEADPYFNQWVVNSMLPHLERVTLPAANGAVSKMETAADGTFRKVRRRVASALTNGLHNRFVFAVSKHGRDLPCEYEGQQIQHLRKGAASLFWPLGRLCPLQTALLRGDEQRFSPTFTRREFAALDREIAGVFRQLLADAGETIHVPDESLFSIGPLISELMPTVAVEEVEAHASNFLKEMARFRGRSYLCASPNSGYAAAFRTFAAKELGKKVVSTQHSGWGGYLADGALVTEILIAGCDEYVTFGWTNRDPYLSNWRDRPVVLPSPFLSELRRKSSRLQKLQRKRTLPRCRSVLFSTAFVYRFPSVYNSFLRVDTVGRWARIIGDVLQKLADQDLKVTLIMYDKVVADLHRETLNQWLAIAPSRIVEHGDHDVRVRHLMQSPRFQDEFDAVLWDLPTGGFSEAIACGIPTFSLWNRELIRSLDFAEPFIADLLKAGVFFANGDDIRDTMERFYGIPGWYHSEDVQKPIRSFAQNFFLSDPNWQKQWAEFLKSC